LAGTTFPINRHYTAELLNFEGVYANSLDGVSDRDFAIEFLCAASLIMVHLSRLSEEVILWSSEEFSFVKLKDSCATGSSIMPQKRKPRRARTSAGQNRRVCGHLQALLMLMKGYLGIQQRPARQRSTFDAKNSHCLSGSMTILLRDGLEFRTTRLAAG